MVWGRHSFLHSEILYQQRETESTTHQVHQWSSVQCLCRQVQIWNVFHSNQYENGRAGHGLPRQYERMKKAWPAKACKKSKGKGCGWTSSSSSMVQSDAKQTASGRAKSVTSMPWSIHSITQPGRFQSGVLMQFPCCGLNTSPKTLCFQNVVFRFFVNSI